MRQKHAGDVAPILPDGKARLADVTTIRWEEKKKQKWMRDEGAVHHQMRGSAGSATQLCGRMGVYGISASDETKST